MKTIKTFEGFLNEKCDTNCKNCGAVLTKAKCDHCNTTNKFSEKEEDKKPVKKSTRSAGPM